MLRAADRRRFADPRNRMVEADEQMEERADNDRTDGPWGVGPEWQRLRIWVLAGAIASTVAAGASFGFDGWFVDRLQPSRLPGDLRKAIQLSEAFAHGYGALMILLAVWSATTGPTRRRVAAAALITIASGLAGNLSKALFVRVRPYAARQITVAPGGGIHLPIPVDASQTAEPVPARWTDARQRSFPSGHAATAWGLAIGLVLVAPRATAVFVLLAVMASLQRIVAEAHYLSDVFAGAAVAGWTSWVLLHAAVVRRIVGAAGSG